MGYCLEAAPPLSAALCPHLIQRLFDCIRRSDLGNFVKIETKLKVTLMNNPVRVLYASENRVGFIIHRPGGCSRPAA